MERMELLKHILIVLDIVMSVAILSVHAYWGCGGTKLTEYVLPAYKNDYKPHLLHVKAGDQPPAWAAWCVVFCFVVQIALLVMDWVSPNIVVRVLLGVATLVFFVRFIGETNVVGVFKRERDTVFAYWDTWLYTPVCFVFALSLGALVFIG